MDRKKPRKKGGQLGRQQFGQIGTPLPMRPQVSQGWGSGSASAADRYQLALTGQGIIAESYPRHVAVATSGLVTQTLYASLVGLKAGDVVSNISTMMGTNGATLTLTKVAIYSKASGLLASSADNSAAFTSGAVTMVTTALTAPYTVPASDAYYLALLCVGTTPPALYRAFASSSALYSGFGSGVRLVGQQAAQADLPATATLAVSLLSIWLAAS
jgi:hypothetical protein